MPNEALAVPEQEFQSEAQSLIAQAHAIVVRNQDEFEQAVEFGKNVSAFIKRVETFFKPLKSAAKAAHQALCDREKEILAVPGKANAIAKAAVNAWKAEQKRKDDEAAALARELGITDEDVPAGFQKVAGTRNRTEWHFEVIDPKLVPDQYWMIDERAIRETVKALREKAMPGGGYEIPGVRVWSTEATDW